MSNSSIFLIICVIIMVFICISIVAARRSMYGGGNTQISFGGNRKTRKCMK